MFKYLRLAELLLNYIHHENDTLFRHHEYISAYINSEYIITYTQHTAYTQIDALNASLLFCTPMNHGC
jgi:hypothetical protein